MDLNLDNYSLDDLLRLFKLRPDFDDADFKKAKQIVLATHPDKSNLPPAYFQFFAKAYKLLGYVHNTKQCKSTTYTLESDEFRGEVARQFTSTSDFNEKFNSLFEKHYVADEETRKGFGDWLKRDDGVATFESRKKEARALTTVTEPTYGKTSFAVTSFDGDDYVDLKSAYTVHAVAGVSEDDFEARPTFETMRSLRERDIEPMNSQEAEMKLARDPNMDARRAFKLAKQYEVAKKQTDGFWGNLMRLT
jgi:hypothetical protein